MTTERTVAELAAHVNGRVDGDATTRINGIADLQSARSGEIAFVEESKFLEIAKTSAASCLIVSESIELDFSGALIRVEKPKLAFARIAAVLHPFNRRNGWHKMIDIAENANVRASFIGAFVSIGKNTTIGEGTEISDGVKIGDNVVIGKRTIVYPNGIIYNNVSIGNDCIIHAGAVIGAPGFGYVRSDDEYVQFPQIGTVVIEDGVEIGANACVDRAALGTTRIGCGTKIDNLVQIAHNVEIGERVIIAAQTGISGSTVIESDAVIGGQVGMGDHARVLSGAIIGSKAGVLPGKIVRRGVWWGVPVQPLDEYKRQNAMLKTLPQMRAEIKELRRRLDAQGDLPAQGE